MSYSNPIIPGFYPDPSCIRVDDIFYMVNSSFQFFPGFPIHRSKDLINWELIGHAINRPDQINLELATTKVNNADRGEIFTAGLYAPTIRYHNGTFYIVGTNLTGRHGMQPSEDFAPRNFVIKATDLSNPASFGDPVFFEFFGIDPSLLFDDDGKVYMQGSFIFGYRLRPATTIKQAEIDLETGELKSELREIWGGTGGNCPEGPHLYKKDGLYWLVLAEGGTHRRHSITVARSHSPWGPFEAFAGNPILKAKSPDDSVQCIGHGEFFNDTEGNWWCTMLARRELDGYYPLGRETYLAPAKWPVGEFPRIDPLELNQKVDRTMAQPSLQPLRKVTLSSPHTVFLRGFKQEFYQEHEFSILLKGMGTDLGAPEGQVTFAGQRQTSLQSEATVVLNVGTKTTTGGGACGLAVYHDTARYMAIDIDADNCPSLVVSDAGKSPTRRRESYVSHCEAYRLTIRSSNHSYSFYYAVRIGGEWKDEGSLGEVSSKIFSTDDFTGPVYGVYASGTRCAEFTGFQIRAA